MPDPVAWTMIEPGWKVLDAAGAEVGRVQEVTGDPNADIFDGLTIRKGILAKDKYVPSEHVAGIVEGELRLALTRDRIEALADFEGAPPEERVLAESSTWYQRLAWWLTGRNR